MGIFDVFKKKDSAPAPAPKPTPAPAAPAPAPAPKPADGLGKPVSLKIKENPISEIVVIRFREILFIDQPIGQSVNKTDKNNHSQMAH